jgi:hypothetical protein
MKRLKTLAAVLSVLVPGGVSSLKSEESVAKQTHAIVRTVAGTATYTVPGGVAAQLKPNVELNPGDTIVTGPDSFAWISVNGLSSALSVSANTTMVIERMTTAGSVGESNRVTDTALNLKLGSILGLVSKLSADSRYEIKTPHGVAAIRGTDFAVSVAQLSGGKYAATFTSLHGQVIVAADVKGAMQTKTLNGGEYWTPGSGKVQTLKPEKEKEYLDRLLYSPSVSPPVSVAPIPVTILPVFPNAAPPLGGSSRPGK